MQLLNADLTELPRDFNIKPRIRRREKNRPGGGRAKRVFKNDQPITALSGLAEEAGGR